MCYITLEDLLLFGSFLANFVMALFAVLSFFKRKK